tara:strand:- start:941 stop:1672 length:732 start_codon:yes stop_codon:yes gene_type:complete
MTAASRKIPYWRGMVITLLCVLSGPILADGLAVDKIYAPYVNLLEKEVEYRISRAEGGVQAPDGVLIQRLGFGAAVSDTLALEAYIIGRGDDDAASFSGYELEARWQLTEQGEYPVDWGVLLEYENSRDSDVEEVAVKLLALREWRSCIFTANGGLIYEDSQVTGDEFETSFSVQARYRYRAYLEPALEFYAAEDYRGIGPVLAGMTRLSTTDSVRWEIGSIVGLNESSADYTVRFKLEYEFY